MELPSRPLVFNEPFDEAVGLWTQSGPGHTKPVSGLKATHSARVAAGRLFVAAHLDALDASQATRVLQALRKLQCLDSSARHGCFRWYYEEPAPVDTNAAFFIGLNLIALERTAADKLEPEGRAVLKDMLADLSTWFAHEAGENAAHYPNKFMGDLVCSWLLQENRSTTDAAATRLLAIMRKTATYWKDQHWGWGEHMSDVYAGVLLDQLSSLLLLSRALPADVRDTYQDLFRELVAIEDQFEGGPRVPAIRSYAGTSISLAPKYRAKIKSWTAEDVHLLLSGDPGFPYGDLFNGLGWHQLAGPRLPVREHVTIPCFGGAVARAWVTPSARLGTLSRYPIMPGTDQRTWGLSWQTMPVAFAAAPDGWGFLRWHTHENGRDCFHPAASHRAGYLNTTLTDAASPSPPTVGLTYSLQEGPDALVIRRMPAIANTWSQLADQFVLTGSPFTVVKEEPGEKVSRLLLSAAGTPVTVFYLSLESDDVPPPHLSQKSAEIIWQAGWTQETLKGRQNTTGAWIICWGRDETTLPVASKQSESWRLTWPRAEGVKNVVFSPLEAQPLRLE